MDMTLLTPPLRVGRRFLLPALVAVTSLLFLVKPAPAPAAPDMEIAVQDDAVLVGRLYYDRERALNQLRDLGVNRIRINLAWTEVLGRKQSGRRYQPKSLVYHWDRYDSAVNAALAHGIRVHLTLTGPAPRWATANHKVGVYRPDSGKYGAFTRSVAAHFAGRVDRYSIWNEPN
jgi:beta-glucosidase/6-phospho-beta-glucosidase/beta-galactosidase